MKQLTNKMGNVEPELDILTMKQETPINKFS